MEKEQTQMAQTACEREGVKPLPNRVHGVVQFALGNLIEKSTGDRFQICDEVALATKPTTTPDILIYPPKELSLRKVVEAELEMPITTIEIMCCHRQTFRELQERAWKIYFPRGVQSAWIVVPELKAIQVLYPDRTKQVFVAGNLHDRVTGIEIPVEKVFQNIK